MCDDVSRINKSCFCWWNSWYSWNIQYSHGGYDWGSATDNKKAENNPSQAIKTGDTAHGEIYAMIMMFAAAGYVFFKQRKEA